MPGGKIVFYTGILPVTQNEAGIAVVMGHEIAHAIHNHGQQRMSQSLLVELGAIGVSVLTGSFSPEAQQLILGVYGVGMLVGKQLPHSRENEHEADQTGLSLMAIAGYNPNEGAELWKRMNALGSSSLTFLSTHPSSSDRIANLTSYAPIARSEADRIGRIPGNPGTWVVKKP